MKLVLASVVVGILMLSGLWNDARVVADTPLAVSAERACPNVDFDRPIWTLWQEVSVIMGVRTHFVGGVI